MSNMASVLAERERVGKFFFRFQDGESGADVFDRVSSFMESMFREMSQDAPVQNMVLVSHGLFMRLFLQRFYRWSVDRFTHLANPHNCEFYTLQRDGPYAGFTIKSPIRTYGDCPLPSASSPDQPTDSCAASLSFPVAPDPLPDPPSLLETKRSQLLRASLTQPLPTTLPAQSPDLRPAQSFPSFPLRLAAAGKTRGMRGMDTENDAFSPRLSSQSLLKGTFKETGEVFRLHDGTGRGGRGSGGEDGEEAEVVTDGAGGRDVALSGGGKEGTDEFEEDQKAEQREEMSEEERESAALQQRRRRATDG